MSTEGSFHTMDRLAREVAGEMCAPAEEQLAALETKYAQAQERFTSELRQLQGLLAKESLELRLQRYANIGLLETIHRMNMEAARPKTKAKRKTKK